MTELLWLTCGLIAVAAGLWLAIAASRAGKASFISVQQRQKYNAQAGTEQLQALQQQLAAGELSQEQFNAARNQLEIALLDDVEQDDSSWTFNAWGTAQKALLPGFLLLGSGFLFWLSNGAQHFDQSAPPSEQQRSIEEMVAGLASKLENEPDNLEGWIMLGRSYSLMQRFADAAKAYGRANSISMHSQPDILVAQAEALGLAQGQSLSGQPLELIQAALKLDPNHVRGLWYGLLAASSTNDQSAQQEYLQRLQQRPDLPPELADILEKEFNVTLASNDSATNATRIKLIVDVAADVRAQIPENATLFVFAKAQNGPPIPLAVSRQSLPDTWPHEVVLDDGMAMIEDMRLSNFDAWTVVARISQSGTAKAEAGDWEARVQLSASHNEQVHVNIDQQIP